MTKTNLRKPIELEDSPLWKRAVALAEQAKALASILPYQESYSFADPIYRTAILVTSDVAMAVGKGDEAAAFDYRYARGHLFTVKGLVLMAEKYGFIKDAKSFLRDVAELQKLLDTEIAKLDAASEASLKPKKNRGQ